MKKGKVIAVLPVERGTSKAGKEWSKQTFVIESTDKFPEVCAFVIFGDKLQAPNMGEVVSVDYNINSREYNGKYYTELIAWKIDKGEALQPSEETNERGADDLPF